MESGTVLDILRGSLHDGPGIRTTVFLKGCPLSCVWCHNPESQDPRPVLAFDNQRCARCGACAAACPYGCHAVTAARHDLARVRCTACGLCATACPARALEVRGRRMTVDEVMAEVRKDRDYYAASGGGLTLSGGEPMMQPGFARALACAARAEEIPVVLETSGAVRTELLLGMLPLVQLFLYDVKDSDAARLRARTGASLDQVLGNLDRLYHAGARIQLRCPLVPGLNDTDAHLAALVALTRTYPGLAGIEVMSYHRMGNEKARRTGSEVRLDQPDAGTAVREEWRRRFHALGCAGVILT